MALESRISTILNEYAAVFEAVDTEGYDNFINTIINHDRIFCIGVGREGMMTRAFAMRLMHMGKEVHWIWDDTTPNIGSGDLLVATLGDGEIGHIDYVCRKAKSCGAKIVVITGSPSGKTAKEVADEVFFIPASVYRGKDKVVESSQPMGNLFEQCLLIILDCVIMDIVDKCSYITYEKMSARHRTVE